ADWIGEICEHDRYRAGFSQQGEDCRRTSAKEHVGLQIDEIFGDHAHSIKVARSPTIVGAKVASFHPSHFLQALPESHEPGASIGNGVGIVTAHHGSKPPDAIAWLRARHERPRRRAAEQREEVAARDHSITSSARASSIGGTVRPIAFAVIRLIASSNLVGCSTGKSSGFAPRKILSTYSAALRNR